MVPAIWCDLDVEKVGSQLSPAKFTTSVNAAYGTSASLNGAQAVVSIGAGEVWLFGLNESAGYRFFLIETLIRRPRTHRRGRRIFLPPQSTSGAWSTRAGECGVMARHERHGRVHEDVVLSGEKRGSVAGGETGQSLPGEAGPIHRSAGGIELVPDTGSVVHLDTDQCRRCQPGSEPTPRRGWWRGWPALRGSQT